MVSEVFARLKAINAIGVTMILVEQNVKAALAITDRAVVLVEGEVRLEGTSASLAADPAVGTLFLRAPPKRSEARQ
jgi:branched-chain amino acid transport system ATP-binding protein